MRSNGCRLPANCWPEPASSLPVLSSAKRAARLVLCAALSLATVVVMAADDIGEYPRRPVTIVVPYAAGGGGDTLTRAIAMQAQQKLGRRVLVENRPGGGGTIGVGAVARADADGYTLAFVSSSPLVSVPNIVKVPYDAEKDFVYIARFMISAYPIVVRADSPWHSFDELLAFARANPGRLRWSTAGINGSPHIAVEAALRQESVRAAFVPMQGSAEVLAGLLGNTLDVGIISDYAPLLAAGRLRVLAEIGSELFAGLEAIPTFEDLGYPLAPTIFFGLAGPAGMPPQLVALWSDIVEEVTGSEDFRRLIARLNGDARFLGHEQFHAFVLDDIATTRRALSSLGLTR
jgi:tripartite-type tricarboxylate transporter receptor subunit TctC